MNGYEFRILTEQYAELKFRVQELEKFRLPWTLFEKVATAAIWIICSSLFVIGMSSIVLIFKNILQAIMA